jgi:hypothetical protein
MVIELVDLMVEIRLELPPALKATVFNSKHNAHKAKTEKFILL